MTGFEKYEEEQQLERGYAESCFSAIKRRLNLQILSEYIRGGGEKLFISNESFRQREDESFSKLNRLLEEKCNESADTIMEQIIAYASVIEEIYFNLGMKAGAILQCRLTGSFETDI